MATLTRIGRAGAVLDYLVVIGRERVTVSREGARPLPATTYEVPNYGTAIGDLMDRPGAALGWVRMTDGAEILYFYDRDDDGFGYALNVTDPMLSEWGYAPFRQAREEAA